ncbi:MAG: T9SS type A sorting domain-containing protein [Chitinophagales bacterium]
MTTKFTHFSLFMSLLFVFSTNIHAQKLLTKGDLKPVIENIFIWHATHSIADIDRSGNAVMGTGTFNDNSISGNEGTTTNSSESTDGVDGTENNDNTDTTPTDDITINNQDGTETNDDNEESIISIGTGELQSDNPIPSRGGNEGTNTDNIGEDDGSVATTQGDNTSIGVEGIEGKLENILEQVVSYPNPASEQINVLIPLMDDMVRIRLISLAGQPVISQNAYSNSRVVLETYHLPEGVYLLEFTSSNKQIYRRTYIKR